MVSRHRFITLENLRIRAKLFIFYSPSRCTMASATPIDDAPNPIPVGMDDPDVVTTPINYSYEDWMAAIRQFAPNYVPKVIDPSDRAANRDVIYEFKLSEADVTPTGVINPDAPIFALIRSQPAPI